MVQQESPAIILVDPQLGENIGMVARAMLNCGATDLRLVRPRDGWPSEKAREASAGALDVVDNARLFETTKDAIADLSHVYATTGRGREMVSRIVTPRQAAREIRARDPNIDGMTGILFGGERSGLNNEDVSLADTVLRVPLNPDFKSLNLAQAVLVVAYEWFQAADDTPGEMLETNLGQPVSKAEMDNFIHRLEEALDAGGFFRSPRMKPTVMRNIRNLFQRARPIDQEISTLHGIVAALKRAGQRER